MAWGTNRRTPVKRVPIKVCSHCLSLTYFTEQARLTRNTSKCDGCGKTVEWEEEQLR